VSGLVVIGASYAGIEAALSAREAGYAEPVTVVADEAWLPYQRPPLSKDFLLDLVSEQNLILRDGAFFESRRIDLVLGQRVIAIDRQARRVELAGGSRLSFDKLVIATGSHARRLSVDGAELDGVCTLRSVADAIDLKARLRDASEIVVIGGGFIGLEVASSAARLGKKVTVIEAAPRLLERAISAVVSNFLLDAHQAAGVDVRLGETVASMIGNDGRIAGVSLTGSARLRADLVLVGVGGIAADELADAAGLRCSNGIVVMSMAGWKLATSTRSVIAPIISTDLPEAGSGSNPCRTLRTRAEPPALRSPVTASPMTASRGSGPINTTSSCKS
jgi:3-phenylpropionate/trans-cinnamate dioxygenase ferredoxin reductase component